MPLHRGSRICVSFYDDARQAINEKSTVCAEKRRVRFYMQLDRSFRSRRVAKDRVSIGLSEVYKNADSEYEKLLKYRLELALLFSEEVEPYFVDNFVARKPTG